ncbi:thioredoxin-like protein [Tenacibaculum skagerrakense]|uniref:Thioredoxin-like protein n=1 Tax=Tenacibaculum skagerrakense TaxID=186571 RepID=A0A4R2P067_9FLAO|nr:thioredoxin family protein [Tenacibaculum skagerrakense]TCP28009.1 thioredoxin-like protein [Tenacibaculum skagerrakense]
MIRFLLIILLYCFSPICNAQINTIISDENGQNMLLGKVTKEGFNKKDFSWFEYNYDEYITNNKISKLLKEKLKEYKIKVFFGSWCGDSKRNVPIFYKVLEEAKFPMENLEVIAVDVKKEAYKQSPNGEEKGLNIHRVPTFILYKEGNEVNRIVEYPKETFERDLLKIVNTEKYTPKYAAVTFLEKLLQNPIDSVQKMEDQLIAYLPEITEGAKELNTYGFVKLRAKEFDKAEYIFKLNTKLYPNNYATYSSLGTLYYEQKRYKEALELLYKSLSLNSKNKKAKELIEEIHKSL